MPEPVEREANGRACVSRWPWFKNPTPSLCGSFPNVTFITFDGCKRQRKAGQPFVNWKITQQKFFLPSISHVMSMDALFVFNNSCYLLISIEREGQEKCRLTELMDLLWWFQNCLYGASNADGVTQHQSVVLYHMNGPVWFEMIKLLLPIEKYYGAHFRLEYRHCSSRLFIIFQKKLIDQIFHESTAKDKTDKRLFGFSFCPLMDRDGTVLPDGQHQLIVYKVEDPVRFKDPASSYLTLPYSTKQVNSVAAVVTTAITSSTPPCALFQRSGRESVTVAFYLCSTKLTQNGNTIPCARQILWN